MFQWRIFQEGAIILLALEEDGSIEGSARIRRAFWPEGSLAQPRSACIAAAQVRLGAWTHSFKEVVLDRGLGDIAACESALFTSGV